MLYNYPDVTKGDMDDRLHPQINTELLQHNFKKFLEFFARQSLSLAK